MPRKVSGFTKRGINWYRDQMAQMILAGIEPVQAYQKAAEIDGMEVQSLRNRISVKEIKAKALEIAGTDSLEDYFNHQESLCFTKQEEAA